MLLSKGVQGAVNVVVILLLLAALILGLTMVLPVKSPTSVLMAKLVSQKGFLSGALSTLDPKAVAKAMNTNPEQTSEMMKELDPKLLSLIHISEPTRLGMIS